MNLNDQKFYQQNPLAAYRLGKLHVKMMHTYACMPMLAGYAASRQTRRVHPWLVRNR